eukprot:CAMPEP_0203831586 /NCGR_PEP_ID=MMETSP0115-20131106/68675_1 /ASSEMBLY_ACC=CAM_ASM_000227 /TAXON_ID=33651 /ORGANISM="Bicosoecid sp, Strain ms1" /LENGTH=400 /DNA_ID=CAMNT_0050740647 /DNA_START=206 /DNA_END=1404 /DNA_ORIENTATION=-
MAAAPSSGADPPNGVHGDAGEMAPNSAVDATEVANLLRPTTLPAADPNTHAWHREKARFRAVHSWLFGHKASWWAVQRRQYFHALAPAGDSAKTGAVFNLVNGILGGGMVAVPFVFVKLGWAVAAALIAIAGVAMAYNMNAFVRTGVAAECDSYPSVIYRVLGPRVGKASQVLMLLASVGGTIGQCVIIGDVVVAVGSYFVDPEHVWRRTITVGIFAAIVFPLALRRDLNGLRSASFVAFLAQVSMVVAIFIQGAQRVREVGWASVSATPTNAVDAIASLPIVAYLFACAGSVFPCYVGYVSGLAADKARAARGRAMATPDAADADVDVAKAEAQSTVDVAGVAVAVAGVETEAPAGETPTAVDAAAPADDEAGVGAVVDADVAVGEGVAMVAAPAAAAV